MVELLLDRSKTYKTQTPDETWWFFKYGRYEGNIGWFIFCRAPGSTLMQAKGTWSEEKVYECLVGNAHVLNDNDLIDLELWLDHGGLDTLFPETKKQLEDERRQKADLEKENLDWLGEKIKD